MLRYVVLCNRSIDDVKSSKMARKKNKSKHEAKLC